MKYIHFLFLVLLDFCGTAQNPAFQFIQPLDRNLIVTGNYGELRPNHFHAGIDFSTHPTSNLPIKAVADGYISRIKISSGGYGKVLYVTHQNGYVTVYAHQKEFAKAIDSFTKSKQIETKQNEIELFPKQNELPVKKGDIIGYTGNSGSSTGPHLHFEIREEKTEIPINPLLVYDVKDHVKPFLTHIALYNTSDSSQIKLEQVEVIKVVNEKLTLTSNTIICKSNEIAFGFSGYDLADLYFNKNNIYEAKLLMDDQVIYHHQLNRIDFDNARYVNVFSSKENGIKFQKCFTPSCYNIGIYKKLINGGKIILADTLIHTMTLIVNDEKGNSNTLKWNIRTKQLYSKPPINKAYNAFCNRDFNLKNENAEINISAGHLANNQFISLIKSAQKKGFKIGDENMILINVCSVALKVTPLKGKTDKMVMMNEDRCVGGKYESGWLKADSKSLGLFYASYDTISPIITCNIVTKKQTNISDAKAIHFKINDKLSGIAAYHVYINDIWHIAEYDAKSETITCYFTNETATGEITIRIEVLDKVSNVGKLEIKATRLY